ncbi:hypothetical protein BLL42_26960 (plasmid) [Pseudomonas frederiksbergensis]|uniref:ParB-like N-terminal domain-containing protein n=1 Tax=Pseudomonas frederiksbergensis TaxID=104087 RepID=A0A1J0EU64_9PSED|nr:ParB/RepB/Spo0J family partition protein [Pseudomonas frederiksbergensis]APC19384.1 hypothetical protein BLL42_26960 [Pseudomonas frederiksbergensis]
MGAKQDVTSPKPQAAAKRPGLADMLKNSLSQQMSQHREMQPNEDDEQGARIAQPLRVDLIDPNPYQPRMSFDAEEIEELAQSIDELGLQSPITVRVKGERFELVTGECRLKAHKVLGRIMISSFVVQIDDETSAANALQENVQRKNLSDFEIFNSIMRMRADFKSSKTIKQKIKISKAHLSRIDAFEVFTPGAIEILRKNPKIMGSNTAGALRSALNLLPELDKTAIDDAFCKALRDLTSNKIKQNAFVSAVLSQLGVTKPSKPITASSDIQKEGVAIAYVKDTKKERVIYLDKKEFTEDQFKSIWDYIKSVSPTSKEKGAQ